MEISRRSALRAGVLVAGAGLLPATASARTATAAPAPAAPALAGAGMNRVDGWRKVSGTADYPNDVAEPGMAHAALACSTIASGRITGIDTSGAESAPGVLAVLTHLNAPKVQRPPGEPPAPLQGDVVDHHGHYLAVVVARTPQQAAEAASLIEVDYEVRSPVVAIDDPRAPRAPAGTGTTRGDVPGALADSAVRYDATFTTPANTHNPMGLFSAVAGWDGPRLTVHSNSQGPSAMQESLAAAFELPAADVTVVAPFVGGGFGSALRTWPHVQLAALAAREVGLPVRLVLTRPQMFTGVGHRTGTVQRLRIGMDRDGTLRAIEHRSTQTAAVDDDNVDPVTSGTAVRYACANVATHDEQVRLTIPGPCSMRAPGEAQGNFALESAIDELSYQVGIDPIELRLRNFAATDQESGLPWSSNALRECYRRGAELFGWSRRPAQPRSLREGDELVGYGVATASFPFFGLPCEASVAVLADGTAVVRSSTAEIGTGSRTVITQLAAQRLGLEVGSVGFEIGDSRLPTAPLAGGSGLTGSLGAAVDAAVLRLWQGFLDLVADDPAAPLRGARVDQLAATGGRLHLVDDPATGETYAAMLARHGRGDLAADGAFDSSSHDVNGLSRAGAFGAQFVEVRVDADLGAVRVARIVSAIDGGRILNEKTARSQIIGGAVGGIGMALFEDTATDPGTGRITNATFADYLIPVNGDVPDHQVAFVGTPDRFNPVGVKGVGEVGLTGLPPAIANAIHHATGKRLRSLPMTLDQLL
ncbi:xanthine dehydrogenase family protein molybdopterin-binding subunit [Saccharopolyspora gloriosae]|uniref:Xanthine dehydrogenase YagR molybdenum-binding subunit n=1 Tax=Saccharopolyspora gloriosae TaxID=455344 RepID=A0A840NLH0_9PSEU|nr:xanthine dehydrogenase family protein molybdopterin-binding subunit [Saccharopolyspora gloriosae]MBB5069107.1 xanthine dehydrogenase YagR molybdenum-binding subunit [Saccharopolyspora gloriosae]